MNGVAVKILVNDVATDTLSALDRGLQFGDGVFETLVVNDGQPRFWRRHMARLQTGCHRLGITPVDDTALLNQAAALIGNTARGVLKIIVTRGSGGRGYRVEPGMQPTQVLQLHPWPDVTRPAGGMRTRICDLRLGSNPQLAGIKHLNRLEQVLARREWDDPAIHEGLLFDQDGHLVEGTMSNLFLVRDGRLLTPDLARCGVAGITRGIVLELAEDLGLRCDVRAIDKAALLQADELFLCNSLLGIVPVISVDGNHYATGELTGRLQAAYAGFDQDSRTWRM